MPKPEEPTITVGELKQRLARFPDHYRVTFNVLSFYRFKPRGPELIQVEFDQSVYLDDEGRVVVENHE